MPTECCMYDFFLMESNVKTKDMLAFWSMLHMYQFINEVVHFHIIWQSVCERFAIQSIRP